MRDTLLTLLGLSQLAAGLSLPGIHNATKSLLPSTSELFQKRAADPADFSWIRRWAAVGDSYTAGIGSGRQLGSVFHNRDDWYCSRYDTSYPFIANTAFGNSVEDFQFPACSGDRSQQIYDQINEMQGSLDLVMMTAGGNDLCLASLLKTCIFLPFQGESSCQKIIDVANNNIDTILKPNIRSLLTALNDKMGKDSIVIYNGYAQFFNTENNNCDTKENWTLMGKWFSSGLALTQDRRKKFNDLVNGINGAIRSVVEEYSKKDGLNYHIKMSDWDLWPQQGVKGQFCDPSSSGHYPDPDQGDLQFFKSDTYVAPLIHDELKKRELSPEEEAEFAAIVAKLNEENIYESLLYKTPDKRAEALHKLSPRDTPAPPSCPGDGSFDVTLGIGLPDTFGKLFHPNELGHGTIASFALQSAMDARADILGVSAPACTNEDTFTCYQKEGRKAYASPDQLNENYKDFCNNVEVPTHTTGWSYSKRYFEGTPDEQDFKISLTNEVSDYSKDECLESMDRVINSCDGNDPNNPMDWKFGGKWVRGEYTYEVSPTRSNRPWPPIKEPYGSCKGSYKVFFGSYTVYGAGWSSWDWGQKTLLPSLKGCMGLGITKWKFEYYDTPTEDGMEWKSTYHTPIWVRQRCMNNNKVQKSAGGLTDGCSGSD